MKLPTIAKIRIPILLVLIVGEAIGFILLQGHQSLIGFTLLSLLGLPVALSFLWIDWIHSRGIRVSDYVTLIGLLLGIPMSWERGHYILCPILVICFSVFAISILRKLLGNIQTGDRA